MRKITVPNHYLRELFRANMFDMNNSGHGPYFDESFRISRTRIREHVKNRVPMPVDYPSTTEGRSEYYNRVIAFYIHTNKRTKQIDLTPAFEGKPYSLDTRIALAVAQWQNLALVDVVIADTFHEVAKNIIG